MTFLQHIQEIDKRMEERKEEEYQKTLFGLDGDMEVGAGLDFSMSHTQTMPMGNGTTARITNGRLTTTQTMPLGNGTTARITNGRLTRTSKSIPGPGGGRTTYRY